MIKHLSPRSEDEINKIQENEIITLALGKIDEYGTKISSMYISVYVNGFELSFHKSFEQVYYEVKFKLVANHLELQSISKFQHDYMNRNWYTTGNLADGDPRVRPYDPMPYQQFIIRPHD